MAVVAVTVLTGILRAIKAMAALTGILMTEHYGSICTD